MASGLNDSYKEAMLGTTVHSVVDLDADTIKVILVDIADDTNNLTTDQDLADIAAGAIVATATLGTKTTTDGTFDSANPTWTAVTGDPVEECDMYKDSGVGSTSPLIGKWEFTSVPPNGGNISGTVNASGWWSL